MGSFGRFTGAATLLAAAAVLPAAASGTSATRVAVAEQSVTPRTAYTRLGGTVEWTNVGGNPHRVVSTTRAWTAFTLAPGANHRVTFKRVGRYPYRIDGARTAAVVVSGGGGGGAGGGQGGGGSGSPPGERRVSYDVTISVNAFSEVTTPLGSAGTEVRNREVTWTGSWQNVTFRIIAGPDGKPVAVLTTKPILSGTIQASSKYSYHDPPALYQAVECAGSLATQTYRGRLSMIVYPRLGTASKMTFLAQPADGGSAWARTVDAVEEGRCDDHVAIIGGTAFDFKTKDGIAFSPNAELLTLDWEQSGPAVRPPFPIAQLLAGRSFGIESGKQADGGDTEAVQVTFKARR